MEHSYRFAVREDVPLILAMIRELADYEGLLPEVVATEAVLGEWLFEPPRRRGALCAGPGRRRGRLRPLLPQLLHLPRPGRRLPGGPLCPPEHRAAGTARASSGSWPASQRSGAAAGWSGGVSTPIPPASTSTSPSAPSRCATGPSTASPGDAGPPGGLNLTASPAAGGAA